MHSCVLSTGPHRFDPVVTDRVASCTPPPQGALHGPKALHGEKAHESAGAQGRATHGRAWMKGPRDAHEADVRTRDGGSVRRTRVRDPAPQCASQGDQVLHSDTGHGSDGVAGGQGGDGLLHDRCAYTWCRTGPGGGGAWQCGEDG